MKKQYIQAELKRDGEKIVFIATDETLDRYNEVIPLDSWDLGPYKKNPVLIVNHDYIVQNIVGKAKNLKIQEVNGKKKALTFEPVFHGITQLAKEVEQMVIDGVLNTVSVGFMRRGPKKDSDREMNELLEISFVPIPANPGAHQLEILAAKGLGDGEAELVEKFVAEENKDEEAAPAPEVSPKKKALREKIAKARAALDDLDDDLDDVEDVDIRSTDDEEDDIVEDNKAAADEETHLDTPESGKGKAAKRLNRRSKKERKLVKVLKRVGKEVNLALYKAKRT